MNKSKLKKDLSQKLNDLNEKIEKIRNTEIDSEDENKWDYDHYSGLQTDLEAALELLKNQTIPGKLDEFGDPIIIEKGILTLLDEWQEENSEEDDE